ncbi:TPA: phage baseplate assembly protein [Escherichia coli]|uniref:phage baseplate assembly protein n=1 Tax=Escherichia coli TaxID=562 RepID=UPI0006A0F7FE|nr:contractile injection system protein, VgrG/Pvc8 family [Escherichia coli]EFH2872189.1 phage tail protein [Escherichia coli]EFH7367310.1 phage tail protein [Escherichia coli]EGI7150966.1 phage tail protein [Escherichia coli]EHW7469791.1 phage tail protein [Escherichia coli]EHX8040562.1 phage tail protein [Escherichia coli]
MSADSDQDAVSLTVGGKIIEGWDSVRVTRGIERFPSDFDLGLMDYFPGSDNRQLVEEGMPCTVRIGNDLTLTGYVDDWEPSISRSRHEVRATGRSKCQDLVDCSAEWPNNVINGGNALEIATRLASYYGISVSTDVSDLIKVPQFTLNWGESPQEIIERVARWSALLYYDQPDGNLLLTRVGTRRAASGIAEGVNVEQAYYRKSMADRFSDYVGVSMGISPIAGYSPDSAYDAVTLATARDPEAARMRYRKHISIIESTLMASQQAQRAIDWEMNRRYGRSKPLTVTTDSWRDEAGKLWEPNTLIPVNMPAFRLPDTELLLADVTYMRDDNGTHARMTLMPPAAFEVQPYAFYQQIPGLNT